ncbi:MAG TPA: nitrous oxide reductase family maturation protein NosD [Thermoprotei archaeon]|nr:nitrous oxide reductase family maturation protein NosD [Thermoprotei archaeon]
MAEIMKFRHIYLFFIFLFIKSFIGLTPVYGSDNRIWDEYGFHYNSISEALENVPEYSTVYVGPGLYNEYIIVDKPVKLIGEGYPVIDGGLYGTLIIIKNTYNVVISGFKIVNSGRAYSTEDAGIRIEDSRNIVVYNNILDNNFFGILIKNSFNISIEKNVINGIEEYYLSDRQHGIYTWYSDRVRVVDNVFTNVKDGIYNDHNYNTLIEGNIFKSGRYGIHLMYSENYTIRYNNITDYVAGMALMYSKNITVKHNWVYFNRVGGIGEGLFIPESDDVLIEDNWIVGNVFGLNIRNIPYTPGRYAVIRYNVIAFNYIGISFDPDSSAYIYGNDFIENIQNVRYIGYRPTNTKWYNETLKLGNFWSDLTGYDVDEDGKADLPYTGADPIYQYFTTHKELSIFYYSPSYYLLNVMFKYSYSPRYEGVVMDLYPSNEPVNIGRLGLKIYYDNIIYSIISTSVPLGIYYYGVRHVRGKRGR